MVSTLSVEIRPSSQLGLHPTDLQLLSLKSLMQASTDKTQIVVIPELDAKLPYQCLFCTTKNQPVLSSHLDVSLDNKTFTFDRLDRQQIII